MQATKRLTKSRSDKVIDGVCGGLGEYFEVDPVLIRLAFVVGLIAHSGGIGLIYIVLMVIIPEADRPAALAGPYATGSITGGSGPALTMAAGTGGGAANAGAGMPGAAEPQDAPSGEGGAGGDPLDARLQEVGRRIDAHLETAGASLDRAMTNDPNRGRRWAAGILIFLGIYFLLDQFNFIPGLDLGRLWPLILILIGVQMLRHRREV